MGDENPIRTLGDYSKPSYEGYRNTIELPVGNNMVPLRSNTIYYELHNGLILLLRHYELHNGLTIFQDTVIMESLVKKKQKGTILELK
ncbi:hypothetical protein Tco_1174328 [Tanacetum coccineum]